MGVLNMKILKLIFLISLFSILFLFVGLAQIDTFPPIISIISPKNGEYVSKEVTVEVYVKDDKEISKIEFYINGIKKEEAYIEGKKSTFYEFTWDTSRELESLHVITIKAYDRAKNVGIEELEIILDNMDPIVKIINPKDGDVVRGEVVVKVEAEDNMGISKVELYLDDDKIGEKTEPPYEFKFDTKDLDNKTYSLEVKAIDKANNISSSKIEIEVLSPEILSRKDIFRKIIGGNKNDVAYSVQQTNDGGYIVAGYTESFGKGEKDIYILKLDKRGVVIWEKTFGGSKDDVAYLIQQTNDGGYIVAGYTKSLGNGEADIYYKNG